MPDHSTDEDGWPSRTTTERARIPHSQQEISAMRDGLYRADFRTRRGSGSGVVHAQDGKMWGGDAQMYYVGSYSMNGRRITAQVTATRHTQRAIDASVFGLDKVT